jgi:hypothetical protein
MASERFQKPKGPPWNGSPKGECTDLRDPSGGVPSIPTAHGTHQAYGIVCTLRRTILQSRRLSCQIRI